MEALNPLSQFLSAIAQDYRISSTHICVYAALMQFREDKGFINPIEAFSHEVMPIAKISGSGTYLKCVKELHEYGYIRYEPSFKNNQRSKIYFINSK